MRDVGRLVLAVRIGGDDPENVREIFLHPGDPRFEGAAFPEIRGMLQQDANLAGNGFEYGLRLFLRTVVDDDNIRENRMETIDQIDKFPVRIVCGNKYCCSFFHKIPFLTASLRKQESCG
jgi:hypothetical protein